MRQEDPPEEVTAVAIAEEEGVNPHFLVTMTIVDQDPFTHGTAPVKEREMKLSAFRNRLSPLRYVVPPLLAVCLISACSGDTDNPSPSTKNLFEPYIMFPTGSAPEAVAIGDVNGDGRNDVVMTTSFYYSHSPNDYKLLVFLQKPDGTLSEPISYATSGFDGHFALSVAIGDINGDGKKEVVIGNDGLNIEVFSQNGSTGLVSSGVYPSLNSRRVKIADLNHDGRLDVVGVGYDTVEVFYQKADGSLNAPTPYPVATSGIEDLEVADVTGDGLTDIVLMDAHIVVPKLVVLPQGSDGSIKAPVEYNFGAQYTGGIALGDVTGDGRNDVAVTHGGFAGYLSVFAQSSIGTLTTSANYMSYDDPESVEIADVNSDGKSDVIVLHRGYDTMGVYGQTANGRLSPEEFFPLPRSSYYNPHGLAVGDINGDTLPDVVIASYDNTSGLVVLYHK